MGIEINNLRQLLSNQKETITKADHGNIVSALQGAWTQIPGHEDQSTFSSKITSDRVESLQWDDPILSFVIERHGGTVNGSSRGSLHHWDVDLSIPSASIVKMGPRQLGPMSKRFDAKKRAQEVHDLLISGVDHGHFEWSADHESATLNISGAVPDGGAPQTTQGRRKRFRKVYSKAITAILGGIGLSILFLYSSQTISKASEGLLFNDTATIPYNKVALVLGTSEKLLSGLPNPFFTNRIKAAADLYHSGKVDYLLLSGDNSTETYNEPQDMKEALVALGVPESRMTLDYAGRRTLDSVIRAKEVFGLDAFTVVSQQFHNERAIFTAQEKGIDAIGYNAKEVSSTRVKLRDWLSRAMAVLDVKVFDTSPRFLGAPINIGDV